MSSPPGSARQDYHDLASGSVLRSAPGYPAFPVRLGQQLFLCASEYLPDTAPISIWDPCCGSGYLATVLGLLNRRRLSQITCSDVAVDAVDLAERNLSLLTAAGLSARADELLERAGRFDKPGMLEAVDSAQRLGQMLRDAGGDLPTQAARADVFNPSSLSGLPRADMVITDVPYDQQTSWQGRVPKNRDPVVALLDSIGAALPDHAVIVICARTRKIELERPVRILKRVRSGLRTAILIRVADLRESSIRGEA